jgi:hypothetical protein
VSEGDRARPLVSGDHAVLFAGHMVDLPDRRDPRFPPAMEPLASDALRDELTSLRRELTGSVVALSAAARGGDILFLEACRSLGIPFVLCLPFEPDRFRRESVEGVDGSWATRFDRLLSSAAEGPMVMPPGDGEDRPSPDAHARFSRWLLGLAARRGRELHLLALWDGKEGDGPGGTADLVRLVREAGGTVRRVDTQQLMERLRQG